MAVIGYMGTGAGSGIQFTVSREVFRTPNNMKWSGSARFATHERHITHALTEFTGLDPDSFSFDMLLTKALGVGPMAELAKIWNYERDGEAVGLVIGGHAYGKYRWNIRKHEIKMEYTDAAGDLYAVEVSVDLLEYLKGEDHNTSSAEPEPEPEPTDTGDGGTDAPGGSTYTAVYGDCLWNIAKRIYGDGAMYTKIYEANRDLIGSNPNRLYPGWTLTIPE